MQKWSAENCTYERGAWLRVCGVPVHVWNHEFFTLCVSAVGKFIHVDEGTTTKARFDFARILVSTPQIEFIKQSTEFFIDGRKFCVNVLEEWGYNLGEDAFLTEVDLDPVVGEDEHFPGEDDVDEVKGEWELDDLVLDLEKEWSHRGEQKVAPRDNEFVPTTKGASKGVGMPATITQQCDEDSVLCGLGNENSTRKDGM